MNGATVTDIPFNVHGLDGHVTVEYLVNEDPIRWGYGLLGLAYPSEVARGFPVVQATVNYPGEGYAAYMGWVQIVRYRLQGADQIIVFDVAPQLSETETPYLAYGPRPTMFDAPSITDRDVRWAADCFLVHTPDPVMTRVIHGLCGFTWSYSVVGGDVRPGPLTMCIQADWQRNLADLGARYPTWRFDSSWTSPEPAPA